jgi:hypothetical protein
MNREEPSAPVPGRDKQAEEDLWQCYKAERGVWTEPMLAALARGLKGKKWFSLIDKISRERTLQLAWEKVRANAGACGVDGITIGRFEQNSQSRLLAVKEHLDKGTYQPKPVKRVWIEKPGSAEKRPLGIPTVTDRVVQAAVRMVIEPIFENRFAQHSYGFRPGRGCKEALRRVEELLRAGRQHVVEVDIKGYFDAIPHDRLMALVREHIADGRVLGLIEGFLKQGVMEGAELAKTLVKPRTRRNNGKSMEAIVADLNRTLCGWFGYFKHVEASELGGIDGWIRMRLRSILRKRRGLEGRGRGVDHHRWPNRYFEKLGLFCLLDARETEHASLRNGANC